MRKIAARRPYLLMPEVKRQERICLTQGTGGLKTVLHTRAWKALA